MTRTASFLIKNAEIWQKGAAPLRADMRVLDGVISAIGELSVDNTMPVIDARGGVLLPGLWDHHIHMAATAAARSSVQCGPPYVNTVRQLADTLASASGSGWLRGIGYHEDVAGMLKRADLDAILPLRPLRIQHRTGRMWFFNSAALDYLCALGPMPPGMDTDTGQLFDDDNWLRTTLASTPPDFKDLSAQLASYGVVGITDMTPSNNPAMADYFIAEQATGSLLQKCLIAGQLNLSNSAPTSLLSIGPAKLHLHEHDMPDYDDTVTFIRSAHNQSRPVATHCVTETELVFALAALEEAGPISGDRIEHASIAPDHLVQQMAELKLSICVQPHFIAERGDSYLAHVDPSEQPYLYRLTSLQNAGISLAGGSDAPYGSFNPWDAIYAAQTRRSKSGVIMDSSEAMTASDALILYLRCPQKLARTRSILIGESADIVLVKKGWSSDTACTIKPQINTVWRSGCIIHTSA